MARAKHKSKKRRRSDRGPAHPAHDAAFQLIFSHPKHAASELQSLLPDGVCRRIRWESMRLKSSSHTDARLTKRFSDVLYEVEIDDEKALIYVLLEHKSEPDPWTLLQLLEYMVRIWRDYLRESEENHTIGNFTEKPIRRLPLILPVVVHHGSSGWTVARRFVEYFGNVPEALLPYAVDFGILLDDVCKINPANLLARPLTPEAKLTMLCLMLGRTPERFFAELRNWSDVVIEALRAEENPVVVSVIIMYMFVVADVPKEETTMALQNALKRGKLSPYEMIMNADKILRAEAIRDGRREGLRQGKIEGKIEGKLEGIREGKLEGIREGKLEGIREGKIEGIREGKIEGEVAEAFMLVSKLLTHRFGPLSVETKARLQSATKAELENMAVRVLSATSLDEVFGKSKRRRKS